ncbi:MAG: formate dehydrogenase accessory sulfurtransferase FdhD [Desulfobacterales bacterium]|nr:formate dehydrogenase accessory sulfurtransferase FdhD [Desulfobacterales bacterium]
MKETPYYPKMGNAGLSPTHAVRAVDANGEPRQVDIAGEFPMTIYVNGQEIVTLMTLGTHPEDLALGYLRNQRLITDIEEIESVEVDWDTESAHIKTRQEGDGFRGKPDHRIITTGCGQGTLFSCTLDGLYDRKPVHKTVHKSTVQRLVKSLTGYNKIYRAAGSVHGCALCTDDGVDIFIEDVGRHNALDTIAGQMWLTRIQGKDKILYTTGRLTSEIVIKAALMEIPVLISRSGITHMGLELARDLDITMIARVKRNNFLVFNGYDRVVLD